MQLAKKTGLFFGSFNPVHIGHLMIANYMAEFTDLDEVWLVVSPQNPLKQKKSLLPDYQRLELVNLAIEEYPHLRACDIEFRLPQPSYTIHTLVYLQEKYPRREFVLIAGGDSLQSLPKWKNYELILARHQLYIYPRPHASASLFDNHPSVKRIDAPLVEISASFIRNAICNGRNAGFLMPSKVAKLIDEMSYYKK